VPGAFRGAEREAQRLRRPERYSNSPKTVQKETRPSRQPVAAEAYPAPMVSGRKDRPPP